MSLPRALSAPLRWMRRPKVWLALVAGGAGLYTLVGFVVVPKVIEKQVPKRLSALLGRPVRLEKATYNPYSFRLTLDGFAVMEPDGEVLVGFDHFLVEPRARSLFGRDIVLERVELEGFRARYQLLPDGATNIADILARLSTPAAGTSQSAAMTEGTAAPTGTKPPRTIHVQAFSLKGARALFEDRSGAEPFLADLGPYSLSLKDFRTQPGAQTEHHFELRSATGEALAWNGTFGLEPLRSEGTLALTGFPLRRYSPYYRRFVGFDLRQGTGAIQTGYTFAWEAGHRQVLLKNGSLRLANLELAPQAGGPVEAKVRTLNFEQIGYDILGSRLTIGEVALEQGDWTVTRGADGSLSLPRLFVGAPTPPPAAAPPKRKLQAPPKPAPKSKSKSAPKPTPPPPAPEPFRLRVERIRIEAQRFTFEDRSLPKPLRTGLDLKRLETGPFTLDPKDLTPFRLEASLHTGGSLGLTGTAHPLQPDFQAELTLTNLELPPLANYLASALKAPLPSGRLTTRLKLEGDFSAKPRLDIKGDAALAALSLRDPNDDGALLDLPGLALKRIAFTLAPLSARVGSLELDRPTARFRLEPGGSNIARALGVAPTPAPEKTPRPKAPTPVEVPPATPAPSPAAPAPQIPIHLDRLILKDGTFTFEDATLKPAATVALERLDIEGSGFSTLPGAPAPVTLRTRLDGIAPLDIRGRFNLLDPMADSDLAVQTRGWDLSPSSPYIVKYLGYAFRKGKLDLDVAWKVRQRKLEAENRAKLDQFYLGEKIPGPDAIQAPIKLGLALLRDRHGVIEADIPVAGTLDSPDFKMRKAIWKAVGNLFTKLATSPFDGLARLIGAKQDLSQAAFQPGQAQPEVAGTQSLDALAKALQARPELSVEVEGAIDPARDGDALRERGFEALLAKTRGTAGPVLEAERPALILATWRAGHPTPKGTKPGPEPTPEVMAKELRDTLPSVEPHLQVLADRRAVHAQDALVRAGIDLARIFRVGDRQPAPLAGVRFKVK